MAAAVCITLSTSQLQCAANVLSNPGFEATPGMTNWTVFGQGFNTLLQTGASTAHSGSNYFKVFQGFTGFITYNGAYQDKPSGPGATYSADGWAYTSSGDVLSGTNLAWLEVTFRDFNGGVLSVYRSAIMSTNTIHNGTFHANTWYDLGVTNQYDSTNGQIIGTVTNLVAPPGTSFVRFEIMLQGDPNTSGGTISGGSVYFDDMTLNQTAPATMAYNIVWSDEFNGTSINHSYWGYDIGNGPPAGWGNNELEYYTSNTQNAYVSNGLLHIVALKQSTNGFSYTSARMKSSGLFFKKYGRFEWRAKLPAGQGYWPALWMFPEDSVYGGWAASGEIDVMECKGNAPTNVLGTIHYGGPYPANTQSFGPSYTFPNGDSVTNFHTYAVQWATNSIAWLVDGQIYETQTNWFSSSTTNTSNKNPYPAPFDQTFFIIMNLAVGGNFGGNPDGTTVFPGDMQVDYVRVYDLTPVMQLTSVKTNNAFKLTWPTNIVCHLQTTTQLTSGWVNLTSASSPYTPVLPAQGSVFYRLVSP